MRNDKILFSESSGFVFEVEEKNITKLNDLLRFYGLHLIKLGKTTKEKNLIVNHRNKKIINLPIPKLKEAWTKGFVEALE